MLVDLVQADDACDGVRLDGILQTPATGGPRTWPLDGLCCIHGTGGNFYSSTLFDAFAMRSACCNKGIAVLRVNTRGHDGISTAATARVADALKGGLRSG